MNFGVRFVSLVFHIQIYIAEKFIKHGDIGPSRNNCHSANDIYGCIFFKKRILILNLADFYSSFAYVLQWLSDKQATGNKLTNGDVLPEANLKQQTY